MVRVTHTRAVVALAGWLCLTACSAGDPPHAGGGGSGSGGSGGGGSTGTTKAAELDDGVEPQPSDASELSIAVVPDEPCVEKGGSTLLVYGAGERAVGFEQLGKVGARRVATAAGQSGFVTMDADGSNASATLIGAGGHHRVMGVGASLLNASASEPAGIGIARYSASGSLLSPATELSRDEAFDFFVGGSSAQAAVVWSASSYLRARVVDALGVAAGPSFDLDVDPKDAISASITQAGKSNFLVAWGKRRASDQSFRLLTQRFNSAGTVGLATRLLSTARSIRVLQLVAVGTGFALLVDLDGDVAVMPLDSYGRLAGSAKVFAGVTDGFGLATHGDQLGMVAMRTDQRPAFRPLDASGLPVGPWVCLDEPAPFVQPIMAIDEEPGGYAVIYRAANESIRMARFNALGTGDP